MSGSDNNVHDIPARVVFSDGTETKMTLSMNLGMPVNMDAIEKAAKGRWRAGVLLKMLESLVPGYPSVAADEVTLTRARVLANTIRTPAIDEIILSGVNRK